MTPGKYQLQLFAFRSQTTAETEARKLQKPYPDIFVVRADLGANGVWYRVRCCSTDSKEEADKKKAEIERRYKITPYVVNR
jgi:cell division protein FtsN